MDAPRMSKHDWIWLEGAFEERAATLHRTGDSESAALFEQQLAATVANVPAALIEQQQKLWDADANAVARIWDDMLDEIATREDNSDLDATDVVAEFCRRAGPEQ